MWLQYNWVLLHATPIIFLFIWAFEQKTAQWRLRWSNVGLLALLVRVIAEFYLRAVTEKSTSELLVLAIGIIVAKIASILARGRMGLRTSPITLWLIVISALACCSMSPGLHGPSFRGISRRMGPWTDPNIYGIYMAVALVAVVGLLVENCLAKHRRFRRRLCESGLLIGASVVLGQACLQSYSRGAWLAAVVGIAFIGLTAFLRAFGVNSIRSSRWTANITLIPVVVGSVLLVANIFAEPLRFLAYSTPEDSLSARFASITDVYDLSWYNRLYAWSGAARLTADHLLLGIGWENVVRAYGEFYNSAAVVDGSAIKTCDWAMLGAGMGVPTLVVLGALIWISIVGRGSYATDASYTWKAIALSSVVGQVFNGTLLIWSLGLVFWFSVGAGIADELPDRSNVGAALQRYCGKGRRLICVVFAVVMTTTLALGTIYRCKSYYKYNVFNWRDKILVMGSVPKESTVGSVFVFDLDSEQNLNDIYGLGEIAEQGFAVFGVHAAGDGLIAPEEWVHAALECERECVRESMPANFFVIFGAETVDATAEIFRTNTIRPTTVCWIGRNWMDLDGIESLRRLAQTIEHNHVVSDGHRMLELVVPRSRAVSPENMVSLRTIIIRLEESGISVSFRKSAAAGELTLRPLALRESAIHAREILHLPPVVLRPRESQLDSARHFALVRTACLVLAMIAVIWWSNRIVLHKTSGKIMLGTASVLAVGTAILGWIYSPKEYQTKASKAVVRIIAKKQSYDFAEALKLMEKNSVAAQDIFEYIESSAHQSGNLYPNIPREIYRDFVLSPEHRPWIPSEIHLRMELWRFLRPSLSNVSNPILAARIVRRQLLNSIDIVPLLDSSSTEDAWFGRKISRSEAFKLHVVSLRAAGVASRFHDNAVEIWVNGQWERTLPLDE